MGVIEMADKKNKRRNNRRIIWMMISILNSEKLRKKFGPLCADKNLELDYKNADQLKKFINEKGKILPRRATGACAKHQRDITLAVKRARHIAILPYAQD